MTYRRRTDANHVAIAKALRKIGAKVTDLSRVGSGVPDLLVFYRGRTMLIEVKTPDGHLNKLQQAWHAEHADCAVFVVTSEQQAIDAVTK